ncbi:undecaprenyl-diphosphate phosphatase [Pullulanibacillus sp. KACC 23026]|uniref:undecaprenyl-diphosphate phosphatase n=1 Tax=Pullulanibacillus sp. KACC 23026 TaxID=3028315 RepID=UPI0023B0D8B7|nr:undecaprenyl-diphosphate phosphatase [Pullulanibacillus sp. KACC 23026]WEG12550.1 undecaprenyl-diphosphate phosphatase [Pullulanibacillus sp. KACC 23026]
MNGFEAFILGLIQGITEFLPISSTGHLYIGRHLFGLDEAGLFLDTMLHFGTLIAIVVFYKDVLIDLLLHPFRKLTLLLIIGTLPAVIFGLAFESYFEQLSKTGATIGWEFLITGALLWFADSVKGGAKQLDQITAWDALIIGCFQATAIFPAISRSGSTIAASLFRKLDRDTAAYFSFLLSTPAIAGAVALQCKDLFDSSGPDIGLVPLFIATLSSALFGYLAMKWMIGYLKKHSLKIFSFYVWILGLFIIFAQALGLF